MKVVTAKEVVRPVPATLSEVARSVPVVEPERSSTNKLSVGADSFFTLSLTELSCCLNPVVKDCACAWSEPKPVPPCTDSSFAVEVVWDWSVVDGPV